MNLTKLVLAELMLLSGLAFANGVAAQAAAPAAAPAAATPAAAAESPSMGTEYTEKGADSCMMCHEASEYPIKKIFKTKHANRADKRAPFAMKHAGSAGLQCEACHGPGKKHADGGGGPDGINSFKATSFLAPAERNKYCLECHKGNSRTGWISSTHEGNNVACSNCHKIHAERDPVLATATQPEVCYTCHRKQRADFSRPSAHPVRQGRITCSECHSPHGSSAGALLAKSNVNQTCYSCHAEKRGPFLWEHAPVAEDCTLCHSPHGSVHQAMLKKTAPLLCQQCHSVAGHPSVARTGGSLPGGAAGGQAYVLAGSCANCHSQVHGSNHPSGVKLMR